MPDDTYRLQELNYETIGTKKFRVYESGNLDAPYTLTLFDVHTPPGEDPERVRQYLNQVLAAHNGLVRLERAVKETSP